MAYRATTRIEPTEEQFKELFDLNMNAFWEHKAYTYYDPKLVFENKEQFRDRIWEWLQHHVTFWQMWWEDEELIGLRAFMPCDVAEDPSGAYINTATDNGPIAQIVGLSNWQEKTMRTDIFLGKPDSKGTKAWYFDEPEIAPTWDNKDGESVYQAILDHGFERAYSAIHGTVQKKMLWENRHKLTGFGSAYDIFLQYGMSYQEEKQVGFDLEDNHSWVYRLIGGESMGWPSHHPLYHHDNAKRPEIIPRPYMETRDDPNKPPEAPPVPETVD